MNAGEIIVLRRWANYLYMLTHSMKEELCPECLAKFDERIGYMITTNGAMYKACRRGTLVRGK